MPRSPGRDKPADHHAQLHANFRWQVPAQFNMADVCMRRWGLDAAHAGRTAVIATAPGQPDRHHTYAELLDQARALACRIAANPPQGSKSADLGDGRTRDDLRKMMGGATLYADGVTFAPAFERVALTQLASAD